MNTDILFDFYTDLHMKVSILELDYTVSAIDIGISHCSMDNQAPASVHLTANRYICDVL
jgi:hypothetical protein